MLQATLTYRPKGFPCTTCNGTCTDVAPEGTLDGRSDGVVVHGAGPCRNCTFERPSAYVNGMRACDCGTEASWELHYGQEVDFLCDGCAYELKEQDHDL